MGIEHKLIPPRTPWQNGKVERSHRNDQRYFYDWETFRNVEELNRKLKEFKSGTLSLGIDDIGAAVASDLTGAQIDNNGVVVSAAEDGGQPVAVGFRARKADGRYRYFWLYRVKFGVPATNLQTKGDSINFSTPTIEGTVTRRNKPDVFGNHPWKTEFTQPTTGADPISADWFAEVYEPVLPTQHSVEPAGDGERSAGKTSK